MVKQTMRVEQQQKYISGLVEKRFLEREMSKLEKKLDDVAEVVDNLYYELTDEELEACRVRADEIIKIEQET